MNKVVGERELRGGQAMQVVEIRKCGEKGKRECLMNVSSRTGKGERNGRA